MIVVDTNVISEVLSPQPDAQVVAWLESLTGHVAITTITLAELLAAMRRLPEGQHKEQLATSIDAALQPYRDSGLLIAFDAEAASYYATITAAREKLGLPMSTADAQIAGICLARSAIFATRNTKDFDHTGVELVNPWIS